MQRMMLAGLAALAITAAPPAFAQMSMSKTELPSEQDLKALTDLRVALVRGVLQLSPEQAKLWPAVEEAIRSRATMRTGRLAKLVAMRDQERTLGPTEIMQIRADGLIQRGEALQKLAAAWKPLYQTLDQQQKQRLGDLAAYGVRSLMLHTFNDEEED